MLAGDVVRVLNPDGSAAAQNDPRVEPRELLALHRLMLLNRALDERMVTLQRQGRIGFYIGSIGEEAAILGAAFVLRRNDWIFPAYREHGAALLRGMPLQSFLYNLFGKSADPVKGRQMPCHEAFRPANFASISSPLATQLPHAVGMAWAARFKKKDDVALAYLGDGATSANDFHAALNFAGVFRTATIFLCRNNQWAISVPRAKQTAAETIASKALGYGIRGVRVDGNDLLAVYAVTLEAREHARQGRGPTLIEAVTYRVQGHSTSDDPRVYRKDDEVAPWRQRDPIGRFRRYLEARKLWSEGDEQQLAESFKEQLNRAITAVEAAAPPPPESIFEEVYAELPWHLREQRDELLGRK
jgi:2-oxoisovalerate dehydrogenase E1 component alpha subunit